MTLSLPAPINRVPFTSVRMPLLYTRVTILVASILSSAFVLANPVDATNSPAGHPAVVQVTHR